MAEIEMTIPARFVSEFRRVVLDSGGSTADQLGDALLSLTGSRSEPLYADPASARDCAVRVNSYVGVLDALGWDGGDADVDRQIEGSPDFIGELIVHGVSSVGDRICELGVALRDGGDMGGDLPAQVTALERLLDRLRWISNEAGRLEQETR